MATLSIKLFAVKYLNKFHVFWIGFWIVVSCLLFVKDIVPSGKLFYKKSFLKNQFAITSLFPLGRTTFMERAQRVDDEPVYFSVYAPQSFSKARVNIIFEVPPSINWRIGYHAGPGFQYKLFPVEEGKREQAFIFDIKDAYYERNRLNFILSNPDIMPENAITVQSHAVELVREEPFSFIKYLSVWRENLQIFYARFL